MGKVKDRRIKVLLIIMSLIVLIQAAYLSYSYLHDKKTFDNTIDITVGYIQVTKIDSVWTYTSSGIDINNERGTENLTDTSISINGKLRPGDKYSKTVTIKNTGDLTANIRISPSLSTDLVAVEDLETPPNKLFLLAIDNVGTSGVTPSPAINNVGEAYEINNVNPNGQITFRITFEVNKNYTEKNGVADKTFSSKVFSVVVDAVQNNGPFPAN